jgi:hypothetical protein
MGPREIVSASDARIQTLATNQDATDAWRIREMSNLLAGQFALYRDRASGQRHDRTSQLLCRTRYSCGPFRGGGAHLLPDLSIYVVCSLFNVRWERRDFSRRPVFIKETMNFGLYKVSNLSGARLCKMNAINSTQLCILTIHIWPIRVILAILACECIPDVDEFPVCLLYPLSIYLIQLNNIGV